MNPQWNTPPNGDFASYVERLSAQAALPKRAAQEGEHGLDVGMTPSPAPQRPESATAASAQRGSFPGSQTTAPVPQPLGPAVKWVVGLAVVVLLMLWAAQVPVGILVMLAGGAVWLAYKFREFKLPGGGVAKWQKVLEDAARKKREQQRKAN